MIDAALSLALVASALGQVDVKLDRFGVGDRWRAGDLTGIQVTFTSDGTEAIPVRVEWEIPDANGDIVQNSRSLVLNPRQPTTRWLYGRLPPGRTGFGSDDLITLVRVFEERDGRRVRELASQRIKPKDAKNVPTELSIEDDLIGVIGAGRCGLESYESVPAGSDRIPSLNTTTGIARGLDARDLPDRWEGLSGFQAIVWTEGAPSALSPEAADSLRSWIRRGGHLVIVLPEAGNPWALGSANAHALSTLLPTVPPERREAVPISELLPILSKSPQLRVANAAMPILVFDPAKLDHGFDPLLALPCPRDSGTGALKPEEGTNQGAIVAVQARVGFGRVTLIGIDVDALNRRRLQQGDLPQADVFWNIVLGRRGDTPSGLDYQVWTDSDPRRLVRSPGNTFVVEGAPITGRIGLAGQAALSLLGILVLFITYWVVAAPLSWVVLGKLRRRRDAWMLFIVIAAGFTVAAWALSRLSADTSTRLQHVTILDWIAQGPGEKASDQPRWARATSWFSASLPGYGLTTVSIEPTTGERNVIGVWDEPPSGSGAVFPNPSRYEAPIATPDSITVPTRATSSEFEARWIGSVDPNWGTLPAAEGATDITTSLEWIVEPRCGVGGTLTHRLPGPLRDVRILHVSPFRYPSPRLVDPPEPPNAPPRAPNAPRPPQIIEPSGLPANAGRFVEVAQWDPGAPLDLGRALYERGPSTPFAGDLASIAGAFKQKYYRTIATSTYVASAFGGESGFRQQLDLLGFYWWLEPPVYMMNPPRDPEIGRAVRTFGHTLDLSPWSNRPCLVIVGFLEDSECPVPILIDDERPESRGLTVVRVIVPLPVDPALLPPSR